jgi:hypothetical protein
VTSTSEVGIGSACAPWGLLADAVHGAGVLDAAEVEESRHTRDRLRRFARDRLQNPPDDAFLAELVAAESDY